MQNNEQFFVKKAKLQKTIRMESYSCYEKLETIHDVLSENMDLYPYMFLIMDNKKNHTN